MTEILRMETTEIHPDGRHFTIRFETDSAPLTVDINSETLRAVVQDLALHLNKARQMAKDPNAPALTPEVDSVRVGPTHDLKAIMVGMRLVNKMLAGIPIETYVVMPPEAAAVLQKQIGEAVRQCRSARR